MLRPRLPCWEGLSRVLVTSIAPLILAMQPELMLQNDMERSGRALQSGPGPWLEFPPAPPSAASRSSTICQCARCGCWCPFSHCAGIHLRRSHGAVLPCNNGMVLACIAMPLGAANAAYRGGGGVPLRGGSALSRGR